MAALRNASLADIKPGVRVPNYDRENLQAGIVHFGVGGFHRAHEAVTIDKLLSLGGSREWAICGVGLLPGDKRMQEVFKAQDCLYTLTLKHPDGRRESQVVGSIIDYLYAPDNPASLIEKLADPKVRIVSLTITEGGYNFDRLTGEFDATNPGVVLDLQAGATPSTVFGYVYAGLKLRRERGVQPFTVMSCDNIQGNGDVARKMFAAFAHLKDESFASWMEGNVAFPNSMVDRITPVTSPEDVAATISTTGLEEGWPVVAEPFFQWVIEDHFPAGRPEFEKAGVQMVKDVMPYELMKLRLLNASHQGLCYFGYLSGYRYAHEATQDPAIAKFLRAYMDEEATPTLLPVPGVDLDAYKNQLIDRFSNPEVRDTLARLCAESSDRIPKWLVPVIRDQLAAGRKVSLSAAIVASWARYAEGVDEHGQVIDVVDPLKMQLTPIALSQRSNLLAFIENEKLFGDLARDQRFASEYKIALKSLFENGAHATVSAAR